MSSNMIPLARGGCGCKVWAMLLAVSAGAYVVVSTHDKTPPVTTPERVTVSAPAQR